MTASGPAICSPARGCGRIRHACSPGRGAGCGRNSPIPTRANRDALRRGQKRVSRQLWHLGPKIIEVDTFVRANRSRDIREAHPELVFLRLNAWQAAAVEEIRGWNSIFAASCSSGKGSGTSTVAGRRTHRYRRQMRRRARRLRCGDCRARRRWLRSGRDAAARCLRPGDADLVVTRYRWALCRRPLCAWMREARRRCGLLAIAVTPACR